MAETTFVWKDAAGVTQTGLASENGAGHLAPAAALYDVSGQVLIGQRGRSSSLPVALSTEDAALLTGWLTDTQLRATSVPVSASTLPLPTGAATDAQQTTTNASLSSLDGKAPTLVNGRIPVDGSGVLQPVSAATLPLPSGAATETTLGSILTTLGGSPLTTAAFRDAFGRQRVVSPSLIFATSSAYDASPMIWETRASGAGNGAAWDTNSRGVVLTLAAAGYVVRQTYRYVTYQPGRSQFVTLTGTMGAAVSGVVKRIGQFDAANGLFFEQGATGVLRVVRRTSTSGSPVDTAVAQADWNIDTLDGTGASGITLDVAKDQIYILDYGWLGTATVRFGIYHDGHISYVHAMDHANILSVSYMQTATLPLRYEISAAGTAATMLQICAAVASEGGYFEAPAYTFSGGREIAAAISVNSPETPIIAIRPALTFGGIPNRITIQVTSIDVLALSASVRWRLLYYPMGSANPVTGGAWASANGASGVEVNASGTALSLAGAYTVQGGFVGSSTGGTNRAAATEHIIQTLPLTLDMAGANSPLSSNVGANPAYLVLAAIGTGATAAGWIDWQETH